MGACATKSGDLKVKGQAPLVVEDAAVPPVAAGEKKDKANGVPVAAETDPADVSRRRSLSDLLKEDEEASDGEAVQETEKVVIEESEITTDGAEVQKGSQAPAQPSVAAEQDDTAEELNGDPKDNQERGDDAQAHVVEEEKRVDPDSVQGAATPGAEESNVVDGAPA
uniref:Uncharacterized protein n=1 Tax=Arundo donax TaxID=35708 RepID=A0A0A9BZ20_ARUDO